MGKKWFVWEKIRRVHPLQNLDFLASFNDFPKPGIPIGAGVKYENRNIELLAIEEEFKEAGKPMADKAISNPKWFTQYLEEMDEKTEAYLKAAKKISKQDFEEMSNQELSTAFEEMYAAYLVSHKSGVVSIAAEYSYEFVSKNVKQFLEKKIKEKDLGLDAGKAFALLSQPEKGSSLIEEKEDFLKLLEQLLKNKELARFFQEKGPSQIDQNIEKVSPEFNKKLNEHWQKYKWIFFMYEGPALERLYFIEQLKQSLGRAMYIAMEFENNKKILSSQKKLVKTLADSEEEKLILSFPKKLIETKATRKDAMYFGSFVFDKLSNEVAKRLGITADMVRYMTAKERIESLAGDFKDYDLLKKRIEYSVFYSVNGKSQFLVGNEAKRWYEENVKIIEISETDELKGTSVFAGKVKGRVRLIDHPNEMNKMKKGDILVSHATNPNLLPAITKASAIVTDVGGITCHAAIVSREFKIPCIVGTNIATQVLKDNDLVLVDAEKGIVKKK